VIAKRKGVVARRGLKEAWSKRTSRCTRTDQRHTVQDELAYDNEVRIHQEHWL
jgi:hypothetical protein